MFPFHLQNSHQNPIYESIYICRTLITSEQFNVDLQNTNKLARDSLCCKSF